jgi:hypothetical protein
VWSDYLPHVNHKSTTNPLVQSENQTCSLPATSTSFIWWKGGQWLIRIRAFISLKKSCLDVDGSSGYSSSSGLQGKQPVEDLLALLWEHRWLLLSQSSPHIPWQ